MNSPLTDVLPDRARKIAYAILFVLALAFAAWQAAGGDWLEFAGGLITMLFSATAVSNTAVVSKQPEYLDHEADLPTGDAGYYDSRG